MFSLHLAWRPADLPARPRSLRPRSRGAPLSQASQQADWRINTRVYIRKCMCTYVHMYIWLCLRPLTELSVFCMREARGAMDLQFESRLFLENNNNHHWHDYHLGLTSRSKHLHICNIPRLCFRCLCILFSLCCSSHAHRKMLAQYPLSSMKLSRTASTLSLMLTEDESSSSVSAVGRIPCQK